jgi:hypothetical protein
MGGDRLGVTEDWSKSTDYQKNTPRMFNTSRRPRQIWTRAYARPNVSHTLSGYGAELRIAETKAVNRALRKAYGIGLCFVGELSSSRPSDPSSEPVYRDVPLNGSGSTNGQPRLRDQLSLLIRQYNLDPTLVKAYAADF